MAAGLAALALAVAAGVVAAVGLAPGAADDRSPTDVDFEPAEVVLTDFAKDGEAVADFSVLGVPLGQTEGQVTSGTARLPGSYLRWTVAGTVDASVTIDNGTPEHRWVTATHRWYTTAPALAVLLFTLFGLASASSHRKGLARRPESVGSVLGLGLDGAVLGAAAAGWAWVAAGRILDGPTLVACAVLGALAGLSAGWSMRSRRPASRR